MDDTDRLSQLKPHDWEQIIWKLSFFATGLIPGAKQLGGKDAQDFAMQAIELLFNGRRHWDPEKVPEVLVYLKGVVRSLVSHAKKSSENKKLSAPIRQEKDSNGHADALDENDPSARTDRIDFNDRPFAESELERKEIENFLRQWASDDNERRVVNCLIEKMPRKEIIAVSGLSAERVDNIMKRLRRALKKFLDQQ